MKTSSDGVNLVFRPVECVCEVNGRQDYDRAGADAGRLVRIGMTPLHLLLPPALLIQAGEEVNVSSGGGMESTLGLGLGDHSRTHSLQLHNLSPL